MAIENAIIFVALGTLFSLGLQIVKGRGKETISDGVQRYLKQFGYLIAAIDKGKYTQVYYDKFYNPRDKYINWALSKVMREVFLGRKWNDTERKKLNEALDAIAKSATRQGIVLGMVGEKKKAELKREGERNLKLITAAINAINSKDPSNIQTRWVLCAVSQEKRSEWLAEQKFGRDTKVEVDALNKLSAACAKKLPGFKPEAELFAIRNESEETLMKNVLKKGPWYDASKVRIHRIGLSQADWDYYTNSNDGTPVYRFKKGYVWVKNQGDDHPYCWAYRVNLRQYRVYGIYESSYGLLVDAWLCGCP